MPDKKLTDKEIVKALKEILEIMCVMGDLQKAATISKSIDLINRLQARETHLLGKIVKLEEECEWLQDTLETTKAEAYKEFAERLEPLKKFRSCMATSEYELSVTMREIDNLLKEMVGEDK